MADTRYVVVSKEWYAQLLEYLLPTERWTTRVDVLPNTTLFVRHFNTGDSTRIIFTPESDRTKEVEGVSA